MPKSISLYKKNKSYRFILKKQKTTQQHVEKLRSVPVAAFVRARGEVGLTNGPGAVSVRFGGPGCWEQGTMRRGARVTSTAGLGVEWSRPAGTRATPGSYRCSWIILASPMSEPNTMKPILPLAG